jgi:hypothetical protein
VTSGGGEGICLKQIPVRTRERWDCRYRITCGGRTVQHSIWIAYSEGAVGTATSAPEWAETDGSIGGAGDSQAALAPRMRARRRAIEKTAKNPILAAATGEARNHW